MKINAAALGALEAGSLENFITAATPGGILAQEARGQRDMIAASHIPKKIRGATREQLTALGFEFGADVDDLFVSVTLPPGWHVEATDHSMHSRLLDEKGRQRAGIFYKAAFYDRVADMSMSRRYSAQSVYGNDFETDPVVSAVFDGDAQIAEIGRAGFKEFARRDELADEAQAWLTVRFPLWNDPLAYWD